MKLYSDHVWEALEAISFGPVPSQQFNPGVCRKLIAEGLATAVELPTPYKTRSGMISHMEITEVGKTTLAERFK